MHNKLTTDLECSSEYDPHATNLFIYRYKMWNLGNNIELIARCEHDAATHGPNGELQMMNIKALNEWDSRVWNPYFSLLYTLPF